MNSTLIFCAFVLLMLAAPHTFADSYERVITPVDGRNMPYGGPRDATLCGNFGKVLNFYAAKNQPLTCERPIPPQMQDFQRPQWQSLNPLEHIDLLRKLDRYLFYDGKGVLGPKREFIEQEWRALVGRNYKQHRIKLSLAKVDLNSDGEPENILKFESRFPCNPTRGKPDSEPGGVHYFVMDETLTYFQKVIILGYGADFFVYRNNAYFDWVTRDGDVWVTEALAPRAKKDFGCHMHFDPKACPVDQRPIFSFVPVCNYIYQSPENKVSRERP